MTATASIVTEEKHGVMLVPNAALRFTPPDVLAQENGARGGLFIPGVTRGSPFGGRGGQQRGQAAASARRRRCRPSGSAARGGEAQAAARDAVGPRAAPRPAAMRGAAVKAAPQGGTAPSAQNQSGFRRRGSEGEAGSAGGRPGGAAAGGTGTTSGSRDRGGSGAGTRVWVLVSGKPEPKWVRTGATDGQVTEVFGDELQPGQEVIVDMLHGHWGEGMSQPQLREEELTEAAGGDGADALLSLRAVTKVYGEGEAAVHALRGVDLDDRPRRVRRDHGRRAARASRRA